MNRVKTHCLCHFLGKGESFWGPYRYPGRIKNGKGNEEERKKNRGKEEERKREEEERKRKGRGKEDQMGIAKVSLGASQISPFACSCMLIGAQL